MHADRQNSHIVKVMGSKNLVTFNGKHGEKKTGPRPVQSALLLFRGTNQGFVGKFVCFCNIV